VLKNIFAGFLCWYFEEIELTLSFLAAEYCVMSSECWRHYLKSNSASVSSYLLKHAVITVKVITKMVLYTKFVI